MPNRHQLMSIAVLSHFQKIREEARIEHLSRMPEYLSIRVFVDIGNYRHIFINEALNMKLTAHQKRLDSTFCYVCHFSWCYDYRSRRHKKKSIFTFFFNFLESDFLITFWTKNISFYITIPVFKIMSTPKSAASHEAWG